MVRGEASSFLASHLVKLPASTRERVLESETSCQALLGTLSPIAKQYCLRIAFSGEAGEDVVENWVAQESEGARRHHDSAVNELLSLGIWTKVPQSSNGDAGVKRTGKAKSSGASLVFRLNKSFAAKVRHILETGIKTLWAEPPDDVLSILPKPSELREHSQACLDSLLLCLVQGDQGVGERARSGALAGAHVEKRERSLDLEEILTRLGLVEKPSKNGERMSIDGEVDALSGRSVRTTRKGFQFLLKPPSEQIWTIVDEFLNLQYDVNDEDGAAAVSFLLQLGFCQEGRTCKLADIDPQARSDSGSEPVGGTDKVAFALAELGLLYPFKHPLTGDAWVIPTHLSRLLCETQERAEANLSDRSDPSAGTGANEKGIIVETNYRVYAYTSSSLKRAVLELFCLQEYVLPNLFVGRLTRESCTAAFQAGIGSEEIIDYLRRNANTQAARMRTRAPVVPETVCDGIRLWEAETKRLVMSPCAYYSNFDSPLLFQMCLDRAKEKGVLLWEDEKTKRLAVDLDYYDEMRAFIKEAKARNVPV